MLIFSTTLGTNIHIEFHHILIHQRLHLYVPQHSHSSTDMVSQIICLLIFSTTLGSNIHIHHILHLYNFINVHIHRLT